MRAQRRSPSAPSWSAVPMVGTVGTCRVVRCIGMVQEDEKVLLDYQVLHS